MKELIYIALVSVTLLCCQNKSNKNIKEDNTNSAKVKHRAKFEPKDGKILLFAGQELEALGGTKDYHDGYYDHFDAPAGFTLYTMINDYPEVGLGGIHEAIDFGAGVHYMKYLLNDSDYNNSILAIGLSIVGQEQNIAEQKRDKQIIELGKFIKNLNKRPVFLRIGFEFDGPWNHYNPEPYIGAFRRIRDIYDSLHINNIAYIWQATGWGSTKEKIMKYYPGDDYVDWVSFSYFSIPKGEKDDYTPLLEIAREKHKPVFIAESTPMLDVAPDNKSSAAIDLAIQADADRAWNEWFIPYFNMIDKNKDVIKAIHYINCRWRDQPMWQVDQPFSKIDARLQLNDWLMKKWIEETSKDKYLKASTDLFETLWNN